MAEQLAEQKTLSDVLEQLKTANTLAATGELPFVVKEELGKTRSVTEDTTNAVKDGSDIVSGAVSKAGDVTNKTAQALQKAQMGVWNGIKSSLGFTGKTLSGMAKITGLQWALSKREGKASRLMEFGKAALKPITSALSSGISTLKDFLGTLAKLGMFLAAGGLLELFTNKKWQEWLKNMWQTMVDKIKKWWEETDFAKLFDDFVVLMEEWYADYLQPAIDYVLELLEGWVDDFLDWWDNNIQPEVDKWLAKLTEMTGTTTEMTTKFDEWARTYNEFRTALFALSIAGMFGAVSPLRLIMSGLSAIFGPEGKIATKWKLIKEAGTWGKWFGADSTLGKMFTSFKSFFGAEGKIATKWKLIKEGATFGKWFGETSTLGKMFQSFKNFFGAEGKIATLWKTIREGANFQKLFGETSTLGKLFTAIKGFFGPESALGKAAIWVGELMLPVKNALMGGAKGTGVVSKLMGVFSWVFGAFGSVWNVLKAIVAPIMPFISGGLKIANAILTPFKVLLFPITLLMSIGALVVGFVQGFMGTEGSIGDKIIGGIKGALQGLVDFFVIDLIVIVQDALNWIVGLMKEQGKFTILGKEFDLFGDIENFTFGDEAKKMSDSFINNMVDSLGGTKTQSDFTKSIVGAGLGKVEDGSMTLDPKMLAKTMEKMSIEGLKEFGSNLQKQAGAGMKISDGEGIMKQLKLKLTEKAEANAAAALNQIDQSTTNLSKGTSTVAMSVAAASLDKQSLLESNKNI